jgi:DME family drug/metabolite transporter
VNPFELVLSGTAIATFGLAVVNSFMIEPEAKVMSRQQFILGLLFAGLIGVNYLALARLPVAVAILLLFTSPIMLELWIALTTRRMPSRTVLLALLLLIVGVVMVSKVLRVISVNLTGLAFSLVYQVLCSSPLTTFKVSESDVQMNP